MSSPMRVEKNTGTPAPEPAAPKKRGVRRYFILAVLGVLVIVGGIYGFRTFVFYEDVKPLMDKGLIKGGSLENAVVIRGEQVLGKEPLRYRDEFARMQQFGLLIRIDCAFSLDYFFNFYF